MRNEITAHDESLATESLKAQYGCVSFAVMLVIIAAVAS